MVTLLYHWNFTGANDLNVNDIIYDSEANLSAVLKSRGTISSSSFSRSEDGILLNNNNDGNGGYYIELEGLNSTQLGGNLSIEMVIQNDELTVSGSNKKSLYFSSTTAEGQLTTNGASLVARFAKNETKFLARPDATSNVSYGSGNPPYRNVSESSSTAVTEGTEHHYIFSVQYDSSTGSSLKIYIDGNNVGENTANLEKELTNTVRGSNIIGTNKDASNTTYLKGVVKYLKIYQNSVSDTDATSIYNSYNTSVYWTDYSSKTSSEKYSRRHSDVTTYFTDNPGSSSFTISGSQLGLSNTSQTYKIHKFVSGSTINISDDFNYIPLEGGINSNIILNHESVYFRITQTSAASNENSLYKCEVSIGNTDNFTLQVSDQGFGDTFNYNNIRIVFGGVEFFINNTAAICFHEDTILTTDQGKIKIKDVKQYHTIEKNKIIYVIKSKEKPNKLVLIKKDAFGENIPYFDVKVTLNHTVIVNNKDVPIFNFINDDSVVLINNDNSDVYNLILLNKKYITVNNLNLGVIFMNDNSFDLLEKCVKNTDKHKVSLSLTPQLSTLKNKYLELDIESYNKFKTC